jgi:hypothetical protein
VLIFAFGRSKVLDVGEITERKETHMSVPSITYAEACSHAEANWAATDGMVAGGGYYVDFEDVGVRLAHIRVTDSGVARLVRWEEVAS